MDSDLHQTPVLAPAGDIGNHVIPEFLVALAGVIGFFAIATRLFARYIMAKLGLPDFLLVIALLFFIPLLYNGYEAGIYPGLGVHTWQFNPKLDANSHFSFKLGTISFGISIAFTKIAILLDWLQIFVPIGTRNALFWILHLMIWSNAIFYFVGSFIDGFRCGMGASTAECTNRVQSYIFASGIINVLSDITILIVPHWVVWKLNMSKAQKKGVSLLFMIGFLAVARLVYVHIVYVTEDVLYYSVIINLWAIAEQTFAFLVIGVPALPTVFHKFKWARRFCSQFASRPRLASNRSGNCERGATWPNSSARGRRDPWDTDTRALVTGEEGEYIPLPDQAHLREERERPNTSTGGI
ncbi:hypothetical protein F5X98DRAFT_360510 [Xylaria grammica]|nr:hypothetical protein F5X98DRAFT_360510 [Xylaria grammica]